MKLTILLLTTVILQVSASSFAQRITLSEKSAPLTMVFEKIRAQTGYDFLVTETMLKNAKSVTIQVNNEKLLAVLNKVFENQSLTFAIKSNSIIVKEKPEPVWFPNVFSEMVIDVSGRITDENGKGIPGANIKVKGEGQSATSDSEGRFRLQGVKNDAILIISYLGYVTQEVKAVFGTALSIRLVESTSGLNEVVVVGFGTQKKINLTGAVDQISSETLENRPITNLGAGLQGLIPNLNITIPNGRANAASQFNIRGMTSLNGGSPLILVDNVPFTESEVARINPEDVATVTVLKDAAAAAIYGARAAFGVVLITTKTPTSNEVKVNLSANTALRTVGKMPELVTDPYTVMVLKNKAGTPLYNLYPESVREYAKQRSEDPSLPGVFLNPTNQLNWMYYGSTDWVKESYFNTAPTSTVNMSVGRSTDKINYLFSGQYFRQDGMVRYGSEVYNRYNVRSKVDFNITKWLGFSNNLMLTSSDYDQPAYMVNDADFFLQINRQSPLDVPKNPDGTWTSVGAATLGRMQEGGKSLNKLNEFQSTFSLNASLVKNVWTLKADASFRRGSGKTNSFDIPIPYQTGPTNPVLYAGSLTSYAQSTNTNASYDVINIYTDAHKQLGNHYLQGLIGYNQEYRKDDSFSARRNNLVSNEVPSVQLATGTMETTESINDWAVQGMFYRLNYNYKSKYLAEFNGRYDGSSRFPENDRGGFFPSASAGWLLSEESFFKPLKKIVNSFKVRGSYGSLGNQLVYSGGSLLNYPYIATMGAGQVAQILGTTRPTTVNAPGAVASSLTWEKVSTVNIGADLSLLKNRLDINFDRYTRFTKDMLVPGRTMPAVFGTGSPRYNAADLKTKGWELRLGWRDKGELAGSPFFYNISFVISDNRSIITKYDNPTGILSDYYVGKEIGEIWGLKTEGFFQNEAELASHADQTAVGATNQNYKFYVGDIKFADRNGDNKVDFGKNTLSDPGDQMRVGNTAARYPYSLNLSGGWKNFDVRVFLQGVGKRDWYPAAAEIYFWGIYAQPWTNITVQNLDHWTPETPNAYFPAVRAYMAERANQGLAIPNERYLQNASYMRVKNLSLGYTLPKNLVKKIHLDNVHFYVSGENLFEISHLKVKLDPEALGRNMYPLQRVYSFGLNVGF